jgi:hypothetical protein
MDETVFREAADGTAGPDDAVIGTGRAHCTCPDAGRTTTGGGGRESGIRPPEDGRGDGDGGGGTKVAP